MDAAQAAGKRHHVTVKALKRVLKKAGLKTTGRKAALTRRAKKAHLMGGAPGIKGALEKAGETGVSAVGTLKEVAMTPVEAVTGAIGKGRRRY